MLRYQENTDVLDLNIFDVNDDEKSDYEKKSRERIEQHRNPNSSPSKRGNWFLLIMLAACILAALFIYIYGKIELNDIQSETRAVEARLDESRRENARLNAKLEGMATPARVEEFAAANGLMREQVSQVTHITVNIERVVEVAESDDRGFLGSINARFDEILEFLSLR